MYRYDVLFCLRARWFPMGRCGLVFRTQKCKVPDRNSNGSFNNFTIKIMTWRPSSCAQGGRISSFHPISQWSNNTQRSDWKTCLASAWYTRPKQPSTCALGSLCTMYNNSAHSMNVLRSLRRRELGACRYKDQRRLNLLAEECNATSCYRSRVSPDHQKQTV